MLVRALPAESIYHRYLLGHQDREPALETFLRRFHPAHPGQRSIRVQFLDGRVCKGERIVELSRKEFALLAYLTLQSRPTMLDTLADALWPDTRGTDGLASVRVYVGRLRKRLNDPGAIVSSKRAYAAGPHILSDLEEADRFARQFEASPSDEQAHAALKLRASLVEGAPAWLVDSPALAPLHARVNGVLERVERTLERFRETASVGLRGKVDAALLDED